MCCKNGKDWGGYFDGAVTSPFAGNAYPSPPSPQVGRSNAQLAWGSSGADAFFSSQGDKLTLLKAIKGTASKTVPGIPSSIAQFPLSALDNLKDERTQRWKLAPALG